MHASIHGVPLPTAEDAWMVRQEGGCAFIVVWCVWDKALSTSLSTSHLFHSLRRPLPFSLFYSQHHTLPGISHHSHQTNADIVGVPLKFHERCRAAHHFACAMFFGACACGCDALAPEARPLLGMGGGSILLLADIVGQNLGI